MDWGRASAVEAKDRLGEANTLRALGDLHLRTDRLSEAERAYGEALTAFREIEDRLGEAYSLKGLGLLALSRERYGEAFEQFKGSDRLHEEIDNQMGRQSSHGYLERVAVYVGTLSKALLLSEKSLEIGRRIDDRFGQTITLELQVQVLGAMEKPEAAFAAMIAHEGMVQAMPEATSEFGPALQLREKLKPEEWDELQANAEETRKAAVDEVRQEFEAKGLSIYDWPE